MANNKTQIKDTKRKQGNLVAVLWFTISAQQVFVASKLLNAHGAGLPTKIAAIGSLSIAAFIVSYHFVKAHNK